MQNFDVALILGSGWSFDGGEVIDHLETSVKGHSSAIKAVTLDSGKRCLIVPRRHFYENWDVEDVAYPISYAASLGCKTIVLTNAAGSIRPESIPGSVVVINDHINLTGKSPAKDFIDMSEAYAPELIEMVQEIEPRIITGVYAQFAGPQYETPAEIRMARILGADLAGMSTALETIAARQLGLKVLGLSLVSNYAAGLTKFHLSHEEVLQTGATNKEYLQGLLKKILNKL